MLILGEKQDWATFKKVANNPNAFLKRLLAFNKEQLDTKILKRLQAEYTQDPEEMASVNQAASLLCKWLHGIIKFHKL